jgi:hypothetical protein
MGNNRSTTIQRSIMFKDQKRWMGTWVLTESQPREACSRITRDRWVTTESEQSKEINIL